MGLVDELPNLPGDRLDDILARFAADDTGLGNRGDDVVAIDQLTELPNRLGIEALFRQWRASDPERHRMLSIALLDLDDQRRLCRDADGVNPVTGVATLDSLGC